MIYLLLIFYWIFHLIFFPSAPNTPIASSKRARISQNRDKDLRSPSALGTAKKGPSSPSTGNATGPPISSSSSLLAGAAAALSPPSPSKIIFSPALRADLEKQKREAEAAAAKAKAAAEAEEEEFDPYLFIKGLPNHSNVCIRGKRCLPSKQAVDSSLITLTLDLDETLVHCSIEPIPNPDIVFQVSFHGELYDVYVRKRPHLEYFLKSVADIFEVVVFTASQKVYADKLLDILDPQKKYVKYRLFREACLNVHGNFIKDLDVLGRDLSKTVLVDNSPHAYGYNVDNGVPIISWYDDDNDTELLKLLEFLRGIQSSDDVRKVVRNHFKTHELVKRAGTCRYDGTVPPF